MIYLWDTKGRVSETHPMPVGLDTPTDCTLGDADQRTFSITTGGGHRFRVRNTGRRGGIIWPPVRPEESVGSRSKDDEALCMIDEHGYGPEKARPFSDVLTDSQPREED
jgi:hypothetical protein